MFSVAFVVVFVSLCALAHPVDILTENDQKSVKPVPKIANNILKNTLNFGLI